MSRGRTALKMLSLLFQVQHSIQLEAVNKIKVDSRWGFETHGFSDKASTTRREWGRFPGSSSCARMLICLLLIGLFAPLSLLLKPGRQGFSLAKVCPFREGLLRIQLHALWCELDRNSSSWVPSNGFVLPSCSNAVTCLSISVGLS